MPKLSFEVNEEGDIVLDVQGAEGKSCTDLTQDIEKLLGKVEDRKYKPEYGSREERTVDKRTRNRRG